MSVARILIATGAVAVLGAAGYAGTNIYITHQIKAAIDQNIARLPAGVSAKYASVDYSLIGNKTSVNGLTLVFPYLGSSTTLTVARLDVVNGSTNLGDSFAQLQANPALATKDMVLPVADKIEVNGLTAVSARLNASLVSAEIEGVRLHPWSLFQPGIPSLAEEIRLLSLPPVLFLPNDRNAVSLLTQLGGVAGQLRLAAAVSLAIDYDHASQESIKETVHVDATERTPATDFSVSYGTIVAPEGFHQGLLGAADATNIEESLSGKFGLKIANTHLGSSDFRDAAQQLVAGAPLSPALANNLKIGAITASGITVQTPMAGTIPIADIGFDSFAFANGLPDSGHFAVHRIQLTNEQLGAVFQGAGTVQMLEQLGLHGLTYSAEIGFRWDLDQQSLVLDRTSVTIDELGSLALDARLDGIKPFAAISDVTNTATLDHATIHYTDASFMNRTLDTIAKMRQLDPETLRMSIVTVIQARGAALGNDPAITSLVAALTSFVQSPKSLTVTAAPKTPVMLTDLPGLKNQAPPEIVGTLGLSAVAGP